jgi:hypothetical protein
MTPTTTTPTARICDPQGEPVPAARCGRHVRGAHYYHCDAYRPTFNCMMRSVNQPLPDFCPVCSRRIQTQLDPYTPAIQAPVCNAGGPYVAECQGSNTVVTLDGSGTTYGACATLAYTWTGAFATGTATGEIRGVQYVGLVSNSAVDLLTSDGVLDSQCSTTVTVQDTLAPVVTAPPDVTVECQSPGGTPVDLGLPSVLDQCDANPVVTNDAPPVFPLGQTIVTWTATDASGNQAQAQQTVIVEDTIPPVLEVTLSPDDLWAPNHRWETIDADIFVEDVCDPDPAVRLVAIESNEPVNATGDGNTAPDIRGAAFGTDDRAFELRVERRGNATGRVYTITYEAEDESGNATTTESTVRVAHDRRPGE